AADRNDAAGRTRRTPPSDRFIMKHGPAAKAAVPALTALIRHLPNEFSTIRQYTAFALAHLGDAGHVALREFLFSGKNDERRQDVWNGMAGEPEAFPVFLEVLQEGDVDQR